MSARTVRLFGTRSQWLALGVAGAVLALAVLVWLGWGSRGPGNSERATATLVDTRGEEDESPSIVRPPAVDGKAVAASSRSSVTKKPVPVSVRIVDEDGRGIPGVTVAYGSPGTQRNLRALGPLSDAWKLASGPSDEQGRSELRIEPGTCLFGGGRSFVRRHRAHTFGRLAEKLNRHTVCGWQRLK